MGLCCFSFTVCDSVNNRVVCRCTEVLNADTCAVFIILTVMWFGCFPMHVEAGLLAERVPSSVQLLWGRCVRQLWGFTSQFFLLVENVTGLCTFSTRTLSSLFTALC